MSLVAEDDQVVADLLDEAHEEVSGVADADAVPELDAVLDGDPPGFLARLLEVAVLLGFEVVDLAHEGGVAGRPSSTERAMSWA